VETKVAENVYWVGAIDWDVRNFHGYTYTTHRGTTYNAYLVLDEKVALVDTVNAGFGQEMLKRIGKLTDPTRIDYLVANHGEIDHSGAIPEVMRVAPQAKLVCSKKGKQTLRRYFGDQEWDFTVVGTGDEINLGSKTLKFIEAPMLHWPDSMFTYMPQEALLLPNDAFGQHLATSQRFADEVDECLVFDEAAKYYANILWPFSSLVIKKIEEVQEMELEIATIAPSHGLIWRNPSRIIEAYLRWAQGEAEPRVVVVYETMWGSTRRIAHALVEGIQQAGIEVSLYALPTSDRSDVIKDLLEARGILVGSSVHNSDMLLNMAAFLEDIRGLKPIGKIGAAFGSYGWGSRAIPQMEEKLRQAGVELVEADLSSQFAPDEDELERSIKFGQEFARRVEM
jgi:anaerobic nitric oxide reductase flavorubredoxin